MIDFVLLSLPIFGVVALGWAAMRKRVVSPGALDALGAFSFRFALLALVLWLIAASRWTARSTRSSTAAISPVGP